MDNPACITTRVNSIFPFPPAWAGGVHAHSLHLLDYCGLSRLSGTEKEEFAATVSELHQRSSGGKVIFRPVKTGGKRHRLHILRCLYPVFLQILLDHLRSFQRSPLLLRELRDK